VETRISSKGQVTLPAPVRKKIGLRTGDVLKVMVAGDGEVILSRKMESRQDPITALDILRETAGLWKGMPENGEEFVSQLRTQDQKRLERLGID
jgi:AbrB family looped-hinge helix DNA binding protein